MGLIKALKGAVGGTLADQWKDYFYCESIEADVLVCKGEKRVSGRNSNTKGNDNIITNGSVIAVNEGQCMIIVEQGKVVDLCAEPGEFIYDTSTEPSIFEGELSHSISDVFASIGKRFTFGGDTGKDQRVYYINTKKIAGNKFGSPQPKKITDEKYGMLEVTFNGEYVFKVVDPALLVHEIIGANPKDVIKIDDVVGSQLKGKFIEKLTLAITEVMRKNKVSFGDMGLYGSDISDSMNTILDESWRGQYGLEITDVAIRDINLTEDSMKRVNKIDDATIFSSANLQSGLMASATADAMKEAAGNDSGAMMGFMGMNMANMAGASAMGVANQNAANQAGGANFCSNCGSKASGNFCANCGQKLN